MHCIVCLPKHGGHFFVWALLLRTFPPIFLTQNLTYQQMGGTVVPRPLNTVSAIMACLYLPNKIHQSATLFAKCNCQNHKIDLSKSKKKKTVKFIQCSYEVYSSKSRPLNTAQATIMASSWLPKKAADSWEVPKLRNTVEKYDSRAS